MKVSILFFVFMSVCCFAAAEPQAKATWASASSVVHGDEPVLSVIKIKIHEGWHIYWKNPGDIGIAFKIKATLPDGWTLGDIQYPKPKRITTNGLTSFAYEGDVLFPLTITPKKGAKGEIPEITATLSWLACNDAKCVPGKAELKLKAEVDSETVNAAYSAVPNNFPDSKLTMLETDKNFQITLTLPEDSKIDPSTYEIFPATPDMVNAASEFRFEASPTSSNTWTCTAEKNEYFSGEIESFSIELFKIDQTSWIVSLAK